MPESATADVSQLASLASQFGVNLPSSVGGESLEFYVQLTQSRELLSAIATTEFIFARGWPFSDTLRTNLVDYFGYSGTDAEEALRKTCDHLAKMIRVAPNEDAGIVTIDVDSRWPGLSEAIARRLVDLVNLFNGRQRRSRATDERKFVEARVASARAELDSAERAYETFLTKNKTYQSSPRLQFEAARYQRRIDLHQQLFITLSQAYEQAKIQEVRDTPVLTVIDAPEGSHKPTRGFIWDLALGLISGVVLSSLIVFGIVVLQVQKRLFPQEYEEIIGRLKHIPFRNRS